MIFGKLLGQTNLPKAQTLYIHKVTNVVVINEYENFVLTTF